MSSVMKSAIATRALIPVHISQQRLYSSRVMREFTQTTVYVLRTGSVSAAVSAAVSARLAVIAAADGKKASLKR